jgi:hypothetical protein
MCLIFTQTPRITPKLLAVPRLIPYTARPSLRVSLVLIRLL